MDDVSRMANPGTANGSQRSIKDVTRERATAPDASGSSLRRLSGTLKSLFTQSTTTCKEPLATVQSTEPAYIILPLYIYPHPGAWNSIYNSIDAHPTLHFSIIINPYNGPGTDAYPDENYIAAISKLNSYANTRLYGYVHTLEATRAPSAIRADITTYAGWAAYSGAADLRLDGIFFDEAPSRYSKSCAGAMTAATEFARVAMGPGHNGVILNPGVVPDPRYYALADVVTAFEDGHAAWSAGVCERVPAALRARSAMMVHHFVGGEEGQDELVGEVVRRGGWRGLYVSDGGEYSDVSGIWERLCQAMSLVA